MSNNCCEEKEQKAINRSAPKKILAGGLAPVEAIQALVPRFKNRLVGQQQKTFVVYPDPEDKNKTGKKITVKKKWH